MKLNTTHISAHYALDFVRPQLGMAKDLHALVSSLLDEVGAAYGLKVPDVKVFQGPALSDVGVSLNLFGSIGACDLRINRFACDYRNLRTGDDLRTVENCTRLVEDILLKHVPDAHHASGMLRLNAWLVADESERAESRQRMTKALWPLNPIPPQALGATSFQPWFSTYFENADQGWLADARIIKSALPNADFFFTCEVSHSVTGNLTTLEPRARNLEKVIQGLFGSMGFET